MTPHDPVRWPANSMDVIDVTSGAIVSQIPFFNYGTASNFAVRPTASGPENEIWVNNIGRTGSPGDEPRLAKRGRNHPHAR